MKVQTTNTTKISGPTKRAAQRDHHSPGAFTLPEVLVSVLLLGIAGSVFFIGLGQGSTFTQENELNMRASQIVGQQMETIRLYTWTQLNDGHTVSTKFTNYFYPNGSSNVSAGIAYTGTVAIADPGISEAYDTDMKQVTVTVNWYSGSNWTTGSIQHKLQGVTYVSHFGMQNYVYESK